MDKSSEMKSDRGKGGKNREGYGGCIHISQLPQLFTFQMSYGIWQKRPVKKARECTQTNRVMMRPHFYLYK